MIEVFQVNSKEDYERCLPVRRQVFIEEQGVSEEREMDAYEGESIYFLALLAGKPVGTGRFRTKKHYLKFERIATLKETRGKGIGTAIMKAMQEAGKELFPDHTMVMHAQLSAKSFYERLGWQPSGEIFQEAGIDHQVMLFP